MRTAKLDQLDGLHTGRRDPGLSGIPNALAAVTLVFVPWGPGGLDSGPGVSCLLIGGVSPKGPHRDKH